ncbi:DNA-binding protein RFX5 [Fragariocoptes setiger]|uniref:DNA-binding protein RFX5 n=1 Tax=Fragariocoptes setiger TaxID=1670756 RepID=A0ABQ7S793_9ACAR|nr:DNA-binding protein RFX5 [Fragariocoptes setiger]
MKKVCTISKTPSNLGSLTPSPTSCSYPTSYLSDEQMSKINSLVREIEKLSDVEKLLLYLQLPGGTPGDSEVSRNKTKSGASPFSKKADREITQTYTWILSHLEEDSNVSLPKQEVYDEYRAFCIDHNLEPLCVADFGKAMKHAFPKVKPRRLGQRGNSRYCYSGLRKKFRVHPPTLPDISEASSLSSFGNNAADSSNGDGSGMSVVISSNPSESSVSPTEMGNMNKQDEINIMDERLDCAQTGISNSSMSENLHNTSASVTHNFIDSHSNDSTCDIALSEHRILSMSLTEIAQQNTLPLQTLSSKNDNTNDQNQSKRRKRSVSQRKTSVDVQVKRSPESCPSNLSSNVQMLPPEQNQTMPLDSIEPTFCISNDCSRAVNQIIRMQPNFKRPTVACDPTVDGFCEVPASEDSYLRAPTDPTGTTATASIISHVPSDSSAALGTQVSVSEADSVVTNPTDHHINGQRHLIVQPRSEVVKNVSSYAHSNHQVLRQPAFTDPRLSHHLSQMGSLAPTSRYSTIQSASNFKCSSFNGALLETTYASTHQDLAHRVQSESLQPERTTQYDNIYSSNGIIQQVQPDDMVPTSSASMPIIAYGAPQSMSSPNNVAVQDFQQFHHNNSHMNSMCSPFVSPRSSPNPFMAYNQLDWDDNYND